MNLSNLYFHICAFFCIILIMVVFFSKEKVNSEETKLYGYMIISSFFDVLIGIIVILIGYFAYNDYTHILVVVLNKIDFIYYIIWPSLLFLYTIYISFQNNYFYNKVIKYIELLDIVFIIIGFILPINLIYEGNNMGVTGIGTTFIYIIAFSYFVLTGIIVFKRIRKQYSKKYIPFIALLIMMGIVSAVRLINPTLLIVQAIFVYIDLIMYFTIENPDVKMNEELNEAKDQAEKANNAKSDFLSSMSHEIRTPLNAIVGFSNELIESDEIKDRAKEDVKNIIMASNSLLELVNGILDISKIEAGKLEIIHNNYNFNKMFNELVLLTKARIGEKPLEFKYSCDESIPEYLCGDITRVKQVILNLLTNAVKYTEEGYVDFQIKCIIKDHIARLIISVEDSGIGIKKENIEKLFGKFERLGVEKNTTVEGTGLGLAITKRLVEMMGGKITVQSVYGKGSLFTITLDQKIVSENDIMKLKSEEVQVTENEKIEVSDKTILVVDDNNLNIKVAQRLLEPYKCKIDCVTSGFECIEKIVCGNKYDLILLDDMMPKMSGSETLAKLKELESFNTPVVALTANAISGMKEEYLKKGFDDYLSKPIEKEELNRVIRKFLK